MKFLFILIIAAIVLFGTALFWAWLAMLAGGALGLTLGYGSFIPAGFLLAFLSGGGAAASKS